LQKIPEGQLQGAAISVNISPDGGRIIAGTSNSIYEIWDAHTMQNLLSGPLEEHRSPTSTIDFIVFSSDGNRIAILYNENENSSIMIFDAFTGSHILGPLRHQRAFLRASLSNCGPSHAPLDSVISHADLITFSPDDQRIICRESKEIIIYDSSTGDLIERYSISDSDFEGKECSLEGLWAGNDQTKALVAHRRRLENIWEFTIVDVENHWQPIANMCSDTPPSRPVINKFTVGCFSRDGSLVSISGYPVQDLNHDMGTTTKIYIWNLAQNKTITSCYFGPCGFVTSMKFSHDSKLVASASTDLSIRLWSSNTGDLLAGPFFHNGRITSMAFTPDNNRIITGTNNEEGAIRVWDTHPRKPHEWRILKPGKTSLLEVLPDGDRVALGYANSILSSAIVNAYAGKKPSASLQEIMPQQPRPDHPRLPNRSWKDPNTSHISIGLMFQVMIEAGIPIGGDQFVRKLIPLVFKRREIPIHKPGDMGSGEKKPPQSRPFLGYTGATYTRSFREEQYWVTNFGHSPDGKFLALELYHGSIRIYDTFTGIPVSAIMKYSRDNRTWVSAMAVAPDGNRIVCGLDNGIIQIHDTHNGNPLITLTLEHADKIKTLAFSTEGIYVASGSGDGAVRVWNSRTGDLSAGPFIHTEGVDVCSVDFSRDGRFVVSGSWDKSIQVWDILEKKPVFHRCEAHSNGVLAVRFSPDGRYVVSGSADLIYAPIRIWDIEANREVGVGLGGHIEPITSVAFSSDGQRIVACSYGMSVRSWNFNDIGTVLNYSPQL
jgi:WD40 repeat protein